MSRMDEARVTRDLLELVGVKLSTREIMTWSEGKRGRAEDWAAKVYLRASDNIVRVPPRPRFLAAPARRFELREVRRIRKHAKPLPSPPASMCGSRFTTQAAEYRCQLRAGHEGKHQCSSGKPNLLHFRPLRTTNRADE